MALAERWGHQDTVEDNLATMKDHEGSHAHFFAPFEWERVNMPFAEPQSHWKRQRGIR